MKIRELIKKLQEHDPEMECYWEDVIDGEHCLLGSIYISTYGNTVRDANGNILKSEITPPVLFFSPYSIE